MVLWFCLGVHLIVSLRKIKEYTSCGIMSVSHTPNQASQSNVERGAQCSQLGIVWGMGHWYSVSSSFCLSGCMLYSHKKKISYKLTGNVAVLWWIYYYVPEYSEWHISKTFFFLWKFSLKGFMRARCITRLPISTQHFYHNIYISFSEF